MASKCAVVGLSEALHRHRGLAEHGIGVTTVLPRPGAHPDRGLALEELAGVAADSDVDGCDDAVMELRAELGWPVELSEELGSQVHGLIGAVSDLGGAIGWHSAPPRSETDGWLHGLLDEAVRGDAALCTATVDGEVAAMGLWKRHDADYFHHMAEIGKIMAHPRSRGLGLGEVVTRALIDSATTAGFETLQLGVRGNNHLAIELYERLGFRVWGRLPNVIEVGDERFDDVRMYLDLGRPAHLVLHGSSSCGPGLSPSRAGHLPASEWDIASSATPDGGVERSAGRKPPPD